jgi:MoaA/NifB/PqqE/SkfB family radical SAM enzyme
VVKIIRQPNVSYIALTRNNTAQPIYQAINETAASIFELINKNYTFDEIVKELSKKYNENEGAVSKKVSIFINEMLKYKTIAINAGNRKNNVPMTGSDKYFTPEYLMIELTSSCRLDCKHCYLGKKDGASIDAHALKKLLSDIAELGTETVQLTGGEPLLYKDVDEVISFLVDNNIRTLVTTGAYIDDDIYLKVLPELSKIGKTNGYVQVSIDGDEKSHNAIRGKPDSFEKVKKLILDLRKNNIVVSTAMSVQETNKDDIESVAMMVKSWGVSLHRISGFTTTGNARNLNRINPFALQKTIRDISNAYSDNYFHITTVEDNINAIKGRVTPNCGCGSLTLAVDSSLNVLPCVMIRNRPSLFNLHDINFKDGLMKIKDAYCSKEAPSEKVCGSCENLILCNGCIAEGLLESASNKKCTWK